MPNNDIYNVIPHPYWDSERKCMGIDMFYNGRRKRFRSARYDHSGKQLTKRQMEMDVLAQARQYDWSITGNPKAKVKDCEADWYAYLGWKIEPYKGPRGQNWNRIILFDENEKPRISRATIDQYYHAFHKHVLPVIGRIYVGDVTRDDIQEVIERMQESRKYDHSTYEHIRKAARQFFEWQRIKCRSIASNPVEDVELPKTRTTRPRRAGSSEELDTIFCEMELNHLIHAIQFTLHSGMRPEEVCGMPDKYDYASGIYEIETVVTRFKDIKDEGKTDNALRCVYLSELAQSDIEKQREMKRKRGIVSDFLFCNAYGSALSPKTMSDTFRKYARRAGSNLSLYELRHTFVSIMDGETSEKVLKANVGHSESMNTQKVYSHVLANEMSKLPEQMNQAFKKFATKSSSFIEGLNGNLNLDLTENEKSSPNPPPPEK